MKIRKQKLHRGFSLIEIMIVLVILAGALAIAWPNLQKPLGRVKLDEASQTLREAIDESRHRAMSQNQSVLIRLRKGAHEVQSGSIDSFAEQLAGDLNGAAAPLSTKQPQVWKLPSDVVVMNVESIDDVPVQDEFGFSGGVSPSSEISSRGDSSASKAVNANQASAPIGMGLKTDFDSGDQEWWVPLNAMGVGSNAKITLLDKSTKKTIHVSYSSTTGGLEISR
ncbi:pilus assembly FimT family protein [Pirellulaceae bacterium SH449]